MSNKQKLENICNILSKEFVDPATELQYTNDFTLLIAIILSAQATDKMVNIVTKELFNIVRTPEDVLNLGIDALKLHIKKLNYFNTKANNIIKTSTMLVEQYSSNVPSKFEELMKLPGVGRKTANVFLNVAHKIPTIAVDTHVFRVTNRLFGKEFKTPEEVENFLLKINKHELDLHTHHLLILHGRYVCKARKPDCYKCKIRDYCKNPPFPLHQKSDQANYNIANHSSHTPKD